MGSLVIGNIKVTMSHLRQVGKHWYYQRAVPAAVQEQLGKKLIKIKLDSIKGNVVLQAERLAKDHDSLFKALREDSSLVPSEQKLAAIALLATKGLKSGDANIGLKWPQIPISHEGETPHIDAFVDVYVERLREGETTEAEDLAFEMLRSPLPILLSETLDVYFCNHQRGQDKEFRKTTKAHWDKLIRSAGDIALASLDRSIAKTYMNSRLDEGLKTQSVKREMNLLSAVINKAIVELEIPMRNPFERLSPSALGDDASKKQVLSKEQLCSVIKAAQVANDDIRRIILLQAATGARLSEIVGLRSSDVKVLDGTSYLHFQIHTDEFGKRTLKNQNSVREVPLLPFAQAAALSQLKDSKGKFLFQRYISKDGAVNGNSADNAVNKWLKKQVTGLTSHSFRHTIKTYLREVTSKAISDEITGHGSKDVSDQYGLGVSLQTKLDALNKAFVGVEV